MPKVPQVSFGSMFFMHHSLSLTFEAVNKQGIHSIIIICQQKNNILRPCMEIK